MTEPIKNTFICNRCKHNRQLRGGCDAFPDDIPDEILRGDNNHSKPLPEQDNNIVFEEGESEDAKTLKEIENKKR